MSKRYLLLILLLGGLLPVVTAQDSSSHKPAGAVKPWGFSSINQVGAVAGQNNNTFVAQSVNGVRYRTWFLGLGAGVDTHQDVTIPLFAELRKSLFTRPNTPFLYVNGGFQLKGEKEHKEKDPDYKLYDPGAYFEAGAGYYIGTGKKEAVSVTFGYSRKEYKKTNLMGTYDYDLNRYAFKVGYRL